MDSALCGEEGVKQLSGYFKIDVSKTEVSAAATAERQATFFNSLSHRAAPEKAGDFRSVSIKRRAGLCKTSIRAYCLMTAHGAICAEPPALLCLLRAIYRSYFTTPT